MLILIHNQSPENSVVQATVICAYGSAYLNLVKAELHWEEPLQQLWASLSLWVSGPGEWVALLSCVLRLSWASMSLLRRVLSMARMELQEGRCPLTRTFEVLDPITRWLPIGQTKCLTMNTFIQWRSGFYLWDVEGGKNIYTA